MSHEIIISSRIALLVLSMTASAALAAPPEPSGLGWADGSTLTWGGVSSASGYHLYRGPVSGLAGGDYGTCLAGSVVSPTARDTERPPNGAAFFYLSSSMDESGESAVTRSSNGTPQTAQVACIPARRLFDAQPNGTASDGVNDGAEARRNPSLLAWPAAEELGRLNLATGEFLLEAEDLHLAGRGLDWSFDRTYRSQLHYDGPLGEGWDFSDNARLRRSGKDLVFHDGTGRREVWRGARNGYIAPAGLYGAIIPDGGGYTMRSKGTVRFFNEIKTFGRASGASGADDGDGPALMKNGTVKFFNEKKGFGFIKEDGGSGERAVRGKVKNIRDTGTGRSIDSGFDPGIDPVPFAAVESARIIKDKETGRSKGFGSFFEAWPSVYKPPPLNGRNAMQGAVGSVPFVGGALASANDGVLFGDPTPVSKSKRSEATLSLDPIRRTQRAYIGSDLRADGVPAPSILELHFASDGRLISVRDQFGNARVYLYDNQNLLRQVVDTLGRTVSYDYTDDGHVSAVRLPDGRDVVFTFDGQAHGARRRLASAGSPPAATGERLTTGYAYASDSTDPQLAGNLVSVTTGAQQPGGPPTIQVAYGATGTFAADRALQVTVGGTNASGVPAGGTLSIDYAPLNPGADPSLLDLPRRRATVTDRNGDVSVYDHNANGNRFIHAVHRGRVRPGAPDEVTTTHVNKDGEVVAIDYPAGNHALFTYDVPGADRFREGNLLEARLVADPLATGGRGDGHGGELPDRVWTFTWEPVFGGLASMTSPPGNDPAFVPDNGGTWSAERYTTHVTYDFEEGDPASNGIAALVARWGIALGTTAFGIGDVDGDGRVDQAKGFPVRWSAPEVLLDASSRQAAIEGGTTQHAGWLFSHADDGRLVRVVDPELNVQVFTYHPETAPLGDGVVTPPPPDGRVLDTTTGGLLASITEDAADNPGRDNHTNPPPAGVTHTFAWNAAGRPTHVTEGRGVLTRALYDGLDRLVELRRAAATRGGAGPYGDSPTGRGEDGLAPVDSRLVFDYDGDGNVEQLSISNPAGARGLGVVIAHSMANDILGQRVRETHPAGQGAALTWQYSYDGEGHLASATDPAGAGDTLVTDEAGRLFSITRGASGPDGGAPATTRFDYDPNGNLATATDPEGGLNDFKYDGADRLVRSVDAVGNTLDNYLDDDDDGDGWASRIVLRGPAGGDPPPDRSGTSNVTLADIRFRKDERGRVFRADRLLFMPAGVKTQRPPSLAEGSLVPGDGAVNEVYEYDRLSRPTFLHRDSGVVEGIEWDGASRARSTWTVDTAGPVVTLLTWDAGGNLAEELRTERSSSAGPPDQQFFTTYFYDALNRLVQTTDNLGGTTRTLYDTLDDPILESDARGPAGAGSVGRKTPFHNGVTVPVNGHGNVTRYAYDGLGRLVRKDVVLTATGEGDGTTSPAPDTSNTYNPDGLLTVTLDWSPRGMLLHRTDDRGNQTTYQHDNLGRLVHTTFADGTQRSTMYDRRGLPLTETDPNGSVVTHTYSAAGKLTKADAGRAPGVEGTTVRDFQYDGLGRVTRARDNNDPIDPADDAVVRLFRDSLGRIVEEQALLGGNGAVRATDNAWSADGLLQSLTYPGGRVALFSYDAANRLVSVADSMAGRSAQFSYYGLDRVHTRTYDDGVRTTMLDDGGTNPIGFDGLGRVTLVRHLGLVNTLIAGFSYRYDAAGDKVSVVHLHDASSTGFHGERFAHDSAGRLVSAEVLPMDLDHTPLGPDSDVLACTLDGEGNWPLVTRNGVPYASTPNNLNEYDESQSGGVRVDDGVPDDFRDQLGTPPDGWNLAYDNAGNETNVGPLQLSYTVHAAVAGGIAGGAVAGRYAHDAFGRTVSRKVPFDAIDVRYTPSLTTGGAVEQRGAFGDVQLEQVWAAGHPLWMQRLGGPAWHQLTDAEGSIVAVCGDAGGVLERVAYDAYGKPTFETADNVPKRDGAGLFTKQSDLGNVLLYHGRRYDHEFGLRTASVNTDLGGFFDTGDGYINPNQDAMTHARPGHPKRGTVTIRRDSWAGRVFAANGSAEFTPVDQGGGPAFKQNGGVACSCCLTCKADRQLLGCNWLDDCDKCCDYWQGRICTGCTSDTGGAAMGGS